MTRQKALRIVLSAVVLIVPFVDLSFTGVFVRNIITPYDIRKQHVSVQQSVHSSNSDTDDTSKTNIQLASSKKKPSTELHPDASGQQSPDCLEKRIGMSSHLFP
jgi:hypothetical protein